MPSKTAKQRRFMAAACNNPKFARLTGMSRKIACEFFAADQRRANRQRQRGKR